MAVWLVLISVLGTEALKIKCYVIKKAGSRRLFFASKNLLEVFRVDGAT